MESKLLKLSATALIIRKTASGKPVFAPVSIDAKLATRATCTNYLTPSASRPHSVVFGINTFYIADPLTRGNSKLDSQVLIFDLLAVKTCGKACKACAKHCYAMKAQKQYPDTYNRRAILTALTRTWKGRIQLFDLIREQLRREMARKNGRRIVRIHSSGDFEEQIHVNYWEEVARDFPQITFYFYTKQDNRLNFASFDALPNVVHCHSVDDQGRLNFGPEDVMIQREKELNASGTARAYLCSYGRDGIPQAKCGKTCRFCMTKGQDNRRIIPLFVEH